METIDKEMVETEENPLLEQHEEVSAGRALAKQVFAECKQNNRALFKLCLKAPEMSEKALAVAVEDIASWCTAERKAEQLLSGADKSKSTTATVMASNVNTILKAWAAGMEPGAVMASALEYAGAKQRGAKSGDIRELLDIMDYVGFNWLLQYSRNFIGSRATRRAPDAYTVAVIKAAIKREPVTPEDTQARISMLAWMEYTYPEEWKLAQPKK